MFANAFHLTLKIWRWYLNYNLPCTNSSTALEVFVLLHDPIERLVSWYDYLNIASCVANYDPDYEESMTKEHLDIAKEVLRKIASLGY